MAKNTHADATADEPIFGRVEGTLTLRAMASSVAGGVAGLVVMAPVIAGIPILLGIFEMEPLAEFSNLVIAEADATLGLAFFLAGGAFVLPLFFVVTAPFLPPREPEYLRGVTISSMFWVSFAFLFWPDASASVNAIFVVVTLVAHWLYGMVLGAVMSRLTGIPNHRV